MQNQQNKVNILLLDIHLPEDSRIKRHIECLLENGFKVYSFNFNSQYLYLSEGFFSRNGERGFRKNFSIQQKGLRRTISLNGYLLSTKITIDLQNALRELAFDYNTFTIIHVHDPFLLPAAVRLKRKFKGSKIVYDRHEAYERYDSRIKLGGIRLIQVHRIYEKLCQYSIDGVVVVSEEYQDINKSFFPNAIITVVPNYPEIADYCNSTIDSKIKMQQEGSDVNLVYFGSLGNNFDRDIDLLLKIAECALCHYPNTNFFIGGQTTDVNLLDRLKLLCQTYPRQFHFLGYTTREDVAKITQNAHIGFLLIRPETVYWVKTSPNKIYEYLACGVVPIIRADCEDSAELSTCSLLFDKYATDDDIIFEVMRLIEQPDRLKNMMKNAFELRYKYSFSNVKSRYLQLYHELQNTCDHRRPLIDHANPKICQ